MASVGTCVVAVAAFLAVVSAAPSARVRRNYVDGYLFDSLEDASIAGDYIVGVGADCSDDDSSESIDRAYIIINKREAPNDQLTRSLLSVSLRPPASASPVGSSFSQLKLNVPSHA